MFCLQQDGIAKMDKYYCERKKWAQSNIAVVLVGLY